MGLEKVSGTVMQPWEPELDCRGRRENMMITVGRAHKQEKASDSTVRSVWSGEGENSVPTAFYIF